MLACLFYLNCLCSRYVSLQGTIKFALTTQHGCGCLWLWQPFVLIYSITTTTTTTFKSLAECLWCLWLVVINVTDSRRFQLKLRLCNAPKTHFEFKKRTDNWRLSIKERRFGLFCKHGNAFLKFYFLSFPSVPLSVCLSVNVCCLFYFNMPVYERDYTHIICLLKKIFFFDWHKSNCLWGMNDCHKNAIALRW